MPPVSLLFLFNSGSVCPNLILKLELQALPFPDGILPFLSGPRHHTPFPPILMPHACSPSPPQSPSFVTHPIHAPSLPSAWLQLPALPWMMQSKEQHVRRELPILQLQELSHNNSSKMLFHLLSSWIHSSHEPAWNSAPYSWPKWAPGTLLSLMHFHFRADTNCLSTFNKGWVWIFLRPALLK